MNMMCMNKNAAIGLKFLGSQMAEPEMAMVLTAD